MYVFLTFLWQNRGPHNTSVAYDSCLKQAYLWHWAVGQIAGFCGLPFLLERRMDTNYIYTWVSDKHLLEHEQKVCRFKANWQYLLIMKLWALKLKIRILENKVSATVKLTIPKHWPKERAGHINKSDFLIMCNKMSQHLEDLSKLGNQYFPTDQALFHKLVQGWTPAGARCLNASSQTVRHKSTVELSRFHVAANL